MAVFSIVRNFSADMIWDSLDEYGLDRVHPTIFHYNI